MSNLRQPRLTSKGTLGRVGKRELPERHVHEQDETEDDRIPTKDNISPTVAEMTARILGQVQLGHAGNPVASDKSVQEHDENGAQRATTVRPFDSKR